MFQNILIRIELISGNIQCALYRHPIHPLKQAEGNSELRGTGSKFKSGDFSFLGGRTRIPDFS